MYFIGIIDEVALFDQHSFPRVMCVKVDKMLDWCPEIPWNSPSCHLLPNHPLVCILTLPCLACQICSDKPADRPERCRESSHEQASPYSNWAGRPCVRANCIMSAALRLQLCTALGGEGVICTYCRFQGNCPLLHL